MHEEKKPKVEQSPALKEIETNLATKKREFKQLQERERILKSQLVQTEHDIIKTVGAYNALSDLKKSLVTPKVPEQKPLSKKDKENIKKNLAKITPEAKKIVEDFAQGTMESKKKK